jgi:hypothetical protein
MVLAASWVTIFVATSMFSMAEDSGPECLIIVGAPCEVNPCTLVDQAHDFLTRMAPSTAEHLRVAAAEFDVERNMRVQQALFREDLVWMRRGYSQQQLDLMVFVAIALSLELSVEREAALRDEFVENPEPKTMKRLQNIVRYQTQAVDLLARLAPQLRQIPERVLAFNY